MTTSIPLHIYSIFRNKLFNLQTVCHNGCPLCPVAVPEIFCSRRAHKIPTAATPYCSLYLSPTALANVPTSIPLHIYSIFRNKLFNLQTVCHNGCPLCPVAVPEIFCSRRAHKIPTAATPYCSLYLSPTALANVPTWIPRNICISRGRQKPPLVN